MGIPIKFVVVVVMRGNYYETIQRKAVIYTMLGIVGSLLLWKYSCLFPVLRIVTL